MTFNKPSEAIQMSLFPESKPSTNIADFVTPKTYAGLAGFHKYWGKKPIESISYLIEKCTNEGDIVMDPFLGSGLISRECLLRNRRFVGIDINPFSIEHASFLLNLPSPKEYYRALIEVESLVAEKINSTYLTSDGQIASHYLWEGNEIVSVWIKQKKARTRIKLEPSELDIKSYSYYKDYTPQHFRNLTFFTNSRINVKPTMNVSDILTGRAMRNIDLLIESFSEYPSHLRRTLLLTLTSSAGQMSNMVFAIKNRSNSKRNGNDDKIEVGSWVIGFWLPNTHFEINAWNCFKNRANKLLKALPDQKQAVYKVSNDCASVESSDFNAWLINLDCRTALREMPSQSVSFVCTDPPHSDRIPYLELSELWNSLLGYTVDFEREIVVSNAKERLKSKSNYNSEMTEFFMETSRVLKPNGHIALYFNARDEESWQYLKCIEKTSDSLKFVGCFPMSYSATSVVQDNRKGSMKSDYVIIYQKLQANDGYQLSSAFTSIPGWSSQFPKKTEGKAK
ncbi:MAG: DNA methylase [Planctomycetes bacterium]|nr:DNA methylase [Planctomycetota bacterium]